MERWEFSQHVLVRQKNVLQKNNINSCLLFNNQKTPTFPNDLNGIKDNTLPNAEGYFLHARFNSEIRRIQFIDSLKYTEKY